MSEMRLQESDLQQSFEIHVMRMLKAMFGFQ